MKRKKVFITRKIPTIAKDLLKKSGFIVLGGNNTKPLTPSELCKNTEGLDAVITLLSDQVDSTFLDICGKDLKVVANYAVGFNNIDLKAAQKRNIVITNTPGILSNAVAEHALTLMLCLNHRLIEADQFVRSGKYKFWDPLLLLGTNLRGKKIGIVGMGRIGQGLAQMVAKGFGAEVLYVDKYKNKVLEKRVGAKKVTLSVLLKTADIVSLHVPLLKSTHHLIGKKQLQMMPQHAILVNTSRGPVIDEVALVEALRKKRIAGAALDVFEHEPKLTTGLRKLKNVILSPHIASGTFDTRNEMAELAAKNVIAVLNGEDPLTQVV